MSETTAVEERAIAALVRLLPLHVRPEEPWTRIAATGAPDYRVHLSTGGSIAVEITRLTDPQIAASDRLHQECGALLERLLQDLSFGVRIQFCLSPGVAQRSITELTSIARELCKELEHGVAGQTLERPSKVGWISVTRLGEEESSSVGRGPRLHLGGSHETFVQARIDAKNEKLSAYRAHEREVYLLLVTNAETHQLAVGTTVAASAYHFDFDRAFVLDEALHGLRELARK